MSACIENDKVCTFNKWMYKKSLHTPVKYIIGISQQWANNSATYPSRFCFEHKQWEAKLTSQFNEL